MPSTAVRPIVRWNRVLILAIAVFGLVTDEPYWRQEGHAPNAFDCAFWLGLLLNGPSGFLADFLSALTGLDEARFVVQYGLWLALIGPQWRLYDVIAARGATRALVIALVPLGTIGVIWGWLEGHRSSEGFVDRYFWFVRFLGIASAGVVLAVYTLWLRSQRMSAAGRVSSGPA